MALKIVWSDTASEDLKAIVLYIMRDDSEAAGGLAERIIGRVENAARFPLSNRAVPEKGDDSIREAIFKPYRIIYAVSESRNTIHVLRVWHSYRGIPELD